MHHHEPEEHHHEPEEHEEHHHEPEEHVSPWKREAPYFTSLLSARTNTVWRRRRRGICTTLSYLSGGRFVSLPPQETLSHEMRGLEKGVRGSVLGGFPFLSERVSDPRSR